MFTNDQVKTFAKLLKKDMQGGWRFLVPEIREAVVAQRVLQIVTAQALPTIDIATIRDLHARVAKAMGLHDDEEGA